MTKLEKILSNTATGACLNSGDTSLCTRAALTGASLTGKTDSFTGRSLERRVLIKWRGQRWGLGIHQRWGIRVVTSTVPRYKAPRKGCQDGNYFKQHVIFIRVLGPSLTPGEDALPRTETSAFAPA